MNTTELTHLALRDPHLKRAFDGVFAVNRIPEDRMLPSALIINLSKIEEPGSHWVAFFEKEGKPGIYFDSYGGDMPQNLCNKLEVCGKYIFNNVTLQSELSSTCGQFCLLFCILTCRGFTLKEIQNLFDRTNLIKNDFFVTEFINKLFKTKTRVFNEDYLTTLMK